MVSIEYMINAALQCDTTLSRAMLRACGVPIPSPRPRAGSIVPVAIYDDMAACFANTSSPLDGRV